MRHGRAERDAAAKPVQALELVAFPASQLVYPAAWAASARSSRTTCSLLLPASCAAPSESIASSFAAPAATGAAVGAASGELRHRCHAPGVALAGSRILHLCSWYSFPARTQRNGGSDQAISQNKVSSQMMRILTPSYICKSYMHISELLSLTISHCNHQPLAPRVAPAMRRRGPSRRRFKLPPPPPPSPRRRSSGHPEVRWLARNATAGQIGL